MTKPSLIEVAASAYGDALMAANRRELTSMLGGVAMELESRHGYDKSNIMARLSELITEASDDELCTLAMGAILRIRLPDTNFVNAIVSLQKEGPLTPQ